MVPSDSASAIVCLAASTAAGAPSTAITSPGATRVASPTVIVAGPQPTSSTRIPESSLARRYAALDSAVRAPWARSTLGGCPWV